MLERITIIILAGLVHISTNKVFAQCNEWQQRADYDISVEFDVKKHRFEAAESINYYNNSPDTLTRLFFHLFYNAFQPGSDMDLRSQWIVDPDKRIKDRISQLNPDEIGYQNIKAIKVRSTKAEYKVTGTILELPLSQSLLPLDSIEIDIIYDAQVPLQIRRTGRFNSEGVDYSMTQWYPKLCMYDAEGWHPDPYIGREFYSNWGDYHVDITIDSEYCIACGAYQTNSTEVSCNDKSKSGKAKKKTWKFFAPSVHDFAWAADTDYRETVYHARHGIDLHCFYLKDNTYQRDWERLAGIIDTALGFIESHYGLYPYKKYAFIQGGDGGMEYPLSTLITGNRPLISLVGVSIHELMHSWFQMMMATNELKYPWMDEGFTSFAETETMNYLKGLGIFPGLHLVVNPFQETISEWVKFVLTGQEEALTTHGDHFLSNRAYGRAAYTKGALTLVMLRYIIGTNAFDQGMLNYYKLWSFKHPSSDDFFRVMEKSSNMELDWFRDYWVNTVFPIDYAISEVTSEGKQTMVKLSRMHIFPLPVELEVTLTDGKRILYYIPLDLQRGYKTFEPVSNARTLEPWHCVSTEYKFNLPFNKEQIANLTLDAKGEVPDIVSDNNHYPFPAKPQEK